jgi:AcrR family transcriptional regulator
MTGSAGMQDRTMSADSTELDPGAVRPPQQERSRMTWERVLDVGTALLEDEGFGALTIANICRRAGVSAPSIYARVDGLTGLFWAIYDRGMVSVLRTQEAGLSTAAQTPAGSPERIAAVVDAACTTFERESRFLRPIIRFALSNSALASRGAESSQGLIDAMTKLLPERAGEVGASIARMIYTECVFRVLYGDHFLGPESEGFDVFRARVTDIAVRAMR